MINRKELLERIEKNPKLELIEDRVPYKVLNGRSSKYSAVRVTLNKDKNIFVDITLDLANKSSLEEMFRPRRFFDIIHPDTLINRVKHWVDTNTLPNLILYSKKGGSGKTSFSQVVATEMVGSPHLCVSANIQRGMDAVKDLMVPFCQNADEMGKKKLLLVEEIGDATKASIDSLKSIHDRYSKNSVMILTTNTMKNISEPLKTRSKEFNFDDVSEDDLKEIKMKTTKRIIGILEILGVDYSSDDVKFLVAKFGNSYRSLILELQTSIIGGELTIERVKAQTFVMEDIFEAINEKDYKALAKISETTNHLAFLEYMVEHNRFLNHINPGGIRAFIYACEALQTAINEAKPFIAISFMTFCSELMDEDVKFTY